MHCLLAIESSRSFRMDLTSAEGKKLEFQIRGANKNFYKYNEKFVNPVCNRVIIFQPWLLYEFKQISPTI